MTILGLELQASNIPALKSFYGTRLNLPLSDQADDQFAVHAGQTEIVFSSRDVTAETVGAVYSFTLAVADAKFDALKADLAQSVTLLSHDGQTVMQSLNTNTRAFYVRDPAGNTVEFASSSAPAPDGATILGVVFVGLPVDDVAAVQDYLRSQPTTEQQPTWPLVFVKPGTTWFPGDAVARVNYVMMTLAGGLNAVTKVLDYPYYIHTAKVS